MSALAQSPGMPSFIRLRLDDVDRRYTGPVVPEARYEAAFPRNSDTTKEIEHGREYSRWLCRSRWLQLKAIARWASGTKNETGLTAISDREKFRIVCRRMKEARIPRDAWEAKWRERLCLSEAAE